MGQQIIKQPNGKYAVFSSISDGLLYYDADKEGIIENMVDAERDHITDMVTNIIRQLDKGEKPYHQFTMSWEEAVELHNKNYSKERVKK